MAAVWWIMGIGTLVFLDDDATLHLGLKYGAREADPNIAIAAVSHATQAAFLNNDVATAGRRWRRQSHAVALSNGQIYLSHVPRLDTSRRI